MWNIYIYTYKYTRCITCTSVINVCSAPLCLFQLLSTFKVLKEVKQKQVGVYASVIYLAVGIKEPSETYCTSSVKQQSLQGSMKTWKELDVIVD